MLWLAGLLGLVAVGSAALTGFEDDVDAGDGSDDFAFEEQPDHGEDHLGDLILPGQDNQDDLLIGGDGDDQINGYGGDDSIHGGDGRDDLYGADGDDLLGGGQGADWLHGEDGADTLHGGGGGDALYGGNDDDRLEGGDGDDTLHGGDGGDMLFGGTGDDAVHGGLGNDILTGGTGNDVLFGGLGNDTLSGLEGDTEESLGDANAMQDYLNGGDGDDLIVAGQGDIVTAGEGVDTIVAGDWITDGTATELMDFDRNEDQLVIAYGPDGAALPEIEIRTDPDDASTSHVLVDGAKVVTMNSADAPPLDQIVLIDHTTAATLGLSVA